MFAAMRRSAQQLSEETCIHILENEKRGVMALYGEDGYPYALPMNYSFDPAKQVLYFHCAKEGSKLKAVQNCPACSFCVYDAGELADDAFPYFNSVIVFGKIRIIEDVQEIEELLPRIAKKYFPKEMEMRQDYTKSAQRVKMLEMHVEHMSGKRVHEK